MASMDTKGVLTHPAAIAVSVVVWLTSLVYTGWHARDAQVQIVTAIAVVESRVGDLDKRLDRIERKLDSK